MQSEMSFPSYYLCIYHRQTERMNIDCGCNNNSLQSTNSGLFEYVSLAVADSWDLLNPPPSNLILLHLVSSLPLLCGGVWKTAVPPPLQEERHHMLLDTFLPSMPCFPPPPPPPCREINISRTAPEPCFLLTSQRLKRKKREKRVQLQNNKYLSISVWMFSSQELLSNTCSPSFSSVSSAAPSVQLFRSLASWFLALPPSISIVSGSAVFATRTLPTSRNVLTFTRAALFLRDTTAASQSPDLTIQVLVHSRRLIWGGDHPHTACSRMIKNEDDGIKFSRLVFHTQWKVLRKASSSENTDGPLGLRVHQTRAGIVSKSEKRLTTSVSNIWNRSRPKTRKAAFPAKFSVRWTTAEI